RAGCGVHDAVVARFDARAPREARDVDVHAIRTVRIERRPVDRRAARRVRRSLLRRRRTLRARFQRFGDRPSDSDANRPGGEVRIDGRQHFSRSDAAASALCIPSSCGICRVCDAGARTLPLRRRGTSGRRRDGCRRLERRTRHAARRINLNARRRATLRNVVSAFAPSGARIDRIAELAAGAVDGLSPQRRSELLRLLDLLWLPMKGGDAVRRATLKTLAAAPVDQLQTGFAALKRLALFLTYAESVSADENPLWQRIGYPG